jgi:hypothetical protein
MYSIPHKLFGSLLVTLLACNQAFADDTLSLAAIDLGGYATARANQNRHGNVAAGIDEISLILQWDNQSRLRAFAEIELEKPLQWREGGQTQSNDIALDLERLYLDYSFSDQFILRGGRFLTPIGRWNLLHASPLVWTTSRPLATTELFPQAMNGMMLHGIKPMGEGALEYSLFAEALKDQREDLYELKFRHTRGGRLLYSAALDLGVTLMAFDEKERLNREHQLLSLDFFKSYQGWELSGEAYFRKTNNTPQSSGGAYLQLVAPLGQQWFAVGRLERLDAVDLKSRERAVVGLTWRYKKNQMFKIEYSAGEQLSPRAPNGILTSLAILF